MTKLKSCTVIYKSGTNQIYNITVKTKDDVLVPLLHYIDINTDYEPYRYSSFQTLYRAILKILRNNGWFVEYHDACGCRWYHIEFIDLNNPTELHRFGTAQG